MNRIHAVLSSDLLSTKVFSIQDLLQAFATLCCIATACYLHKVFKTRQSNACTNQSAHSINRQRRRVRPRKEIAEVAESINEVVSHLVQSQYVMKDKATYASIYQTPLKDSLISLKALSETLQRSANYSPKQNIHFNNTNQYQFVPRISAKKYINSAPVGTQQVLQDILPAIKDFAEQEKIELHLSEFAHGFMQIPTGLCEKMLRELLLNAIKHNPKGTKVQFRCSFTKSYAVFEIRDDGKGISARDLNFDTSYRGKSNLPQGRRLSDGETQINLKSISVNANKIGGSLSIKTALDIGTTARLMIPAHIIVPRPKYQQYKINKELPLADNTQRKKILIVSQQDMLANIINERSEMNYAVYHFRSFDKGLAALHEVAPDIVIADFSWQYALGIQFCQFLRGSTAFAQTPFLMVSMAVDQATRVKMYASGVSAIVEKPLDPQELCTVIGNIARNQQTFRNEIREARAVYQANEGSANIDDKQRTFIINLQELVERNYQQEEFNRFSAAAALNISEKTLQRRMSECFKVSFSQYLRKVRLEKAREKLLQGYLITEVSYEVGFNSSSYFGQCFKQEFGYPPSMLSKAYS